MATYDEIENAIIKRVVDAWTPTGHKWTIQNDELETDGQPWIRISVNYAGGEIASRIGNNRVIRQRQGVVIVQLFVPVNMGTQDVNTLKQRIIDAFERIDVNDSVKYSDTTPTRVPVNNGFFQENISAAFRWETRV